MTKNIEIFYWKSNDDWWDIDENNKPYLTESAPERAIESFKLYNFYIENGIA